MPQQRNVFFSRIQFILLFLRQWKKLNANSPRSHRPINHSLVLESEEMILSAWAAITECHRLGALRERKLFSHSLGDRKGWYLLRALFLGCRQPPSYQVLTCVSSVHKQKAMDVIFPILSCTLGNGFSQFIDREKFFLPS